MKEGTVVLVTGKIDNKIKDAPTEPQLGVVQGMTAEKKLIVLLGSGDFVYLNSYEVAPIEEQITKVPEEEIADE